ncbi:MAG TPA: hypothetical protein EYP85_12295 [Armatimonadetes bacterium]|nr:hypothetical protein [Armatimonadota bacterium]
MAEVAGLIAPRPVLFESGVQDQGFPVETAQEAFAQVQRIYTAAGVPERCLHDVFEGGHQFHGPVAYQFFDRWL